jgi:hypothetical protein
VVDRRQHPELQIRALSGILCDFDVEIDLARRLLPDGIEPVESPRCWGRILVNLLHLQMEGLGIGAFWNLDVALQVEPDERCGSIDRAAFELRLGADAPGYLSLLQQEGHPVYLGDLEVNEVPQLEAADEEGTIMLAPHDGREPGQQVVRWGQKLAIVGGEVLRRDYRFEGVLAAERPAPGSGASLFAHPFFGFDPAELGHCREIQWLRPGQATLDYFQRDLYRPQARQC